MGLEAQLPVVAMGQASLCRTEAAKVSGFWGLGLGFGV